jgi:hypothetical protein
MQTVETKIEKPLPKIVPLQGSVCPQFRRCGKPNCRCAKGELHGAYFYRFWREGVKLRKQYIPRSQVEQVRAACAAYRAEREKERLQREQGWQTFRELMSLLRNLEGQTQ